MKSVQEKNPEKIKETILFKNKNEEINNNKSDKNLHKVKRKSIKEQKKENENENVNDNTLSIIRMIHQI